MSRILLLLLFSFPVFMSNTMEVGNLAKVYKKEGYVITKAGDKISGTLLLRRDKTYDEVKIKFIDFSTTVKVSRLRSDSKLDIIKWFQKQWDLYFTTEHNPNLALYNLAEMKSAGIWNHEKRIIQKYMLSSVKII